MNEITLNERIRYLWVTNIPGAHHMTWEQIAREVRLYAQEEPLPPLYPDYERD